MKPRPMLRWLPLAATCALALALVPSCAYFGILSDEDIGIRVQEVGASPRSDGVELTFTLLLTNFTHADLMIKSLDYHLFFNDIDILSGKLDQNVALPSKGTEELKLPVRVEYAKVTAPLKSIVSRGKSRYRIEGAVVVGAPLWNPRLPFKKEGDLGLGSLL